MRNFFSRIMYGRYGSDEFNLFLLGIWLVLFVLRLIIRVNVIQIVLEVVSYVCVIYALIRMWSRNYDRRRAENDWYLEKIHPAFLSVKNKFSQIRDREHKYYHCPSCHETLRVPRGKGKIRIHCRSCGTTFEAKT